MHFPVLTNVCHRDLCMITVLDVAGALPFRAQFGCVVRTNNRHHGNPPPPEYGKLCAKGSLCVGPREPCSRNSRRRFQLRRRVKLGNSREPRGRTECQSFVARQLRNIATKFGSSILCHEPTPLGSPNLATIRSHVWMVATTLRHDPGKHRAGQFKPFHFMATFFEAVSSPRRGRF